MDFRSHVPTTALCLYAMQATVCEHPDDSFAFMAQQLGEGRAAPREGRPAAQRGGGRGPSGGRPADARFLALLQRLRGPRLAVVALQQGLKGSRGDSVHNERPPRVRRRLGITAAAAALAEAGVAPLSSKSSAVVPDDSAGAKVLPCSVKLEPIGPKPAARSLCSDTTCGRPVAVTARDEWETEEEEEVARQCAESTLRGLLHVAVSSASGDVVLPSDVPTRGDLTSCGRWRLSPRPRWHRWRLRNPCWRTRRSKS